MVYYLFTAWIFIMVFSYIKIIRAHLITIEISKGLKKNNYRSRRPK